MDDTRADRGWALIELGRAKDAERSFRDHLTDNPGDASALSGLATALLDQERTDDALAAVSQAIRADPTSAQSLYTMSRVRRARNEGRLAHQAILGALEILPYSSGLHQHLALVVEDLGDPVGAIEAAEHARQLDPADAQASAILGALHYDHGEYTAAANSIDQALAIDPENSFALSVHTRLSLVHRGGSRQAVAASRRALQLDPANADRRNEVAVAMKSRNPLYLALLRFSAHRQRSRRTGLILTIAPLVLIILMRPFIAHTGAKIVIGLALATVALSHMLNPVMNLTLMASRYSRSLIEPRDRTSALLVGGFLLAACTVGILAAVRASAALLGVAAALLIWSFVAGGAPARPERWRTLMIVLGVVAFAALAAAVLVLTGATQVGPIVVALFVAGVVGTWYVSAPTMGR